MARPWLYVPPEGAEVGHRAAAAGRAGIKEGVVHAARRTAVPDDLPAGVDGVAELLRPGEGAQVGHRAAAAGRAGVEEGVVTAVRRRSAIPHDLPIGVDAAAEAFRHSAGIGKEVAQVGHGTAALGSTGIYERRG